MSQVLGSTIPAGPHFTDAQQKSQTHKHVAKVWADQCMTFEKGAEVLEGQQQQIEDIRSPLKDWEPIVTSTGGFALKYKPSGREYVPTEHALTGLSVASRMGTWQTIALTEPVRHATKVDKTTGDKSVVYKRDKRDSELLVHMFNVHTFQADRMDLEKARLFRTWKDGTLRAFLSELYSIVNNAWVLNAFKQLIPGGLLSHWKGDADAIFGNILIPDTIREEDDSDYGGMVSIGNSEIGTRRLSSLPSVFRAICMNGCIWNQEQGEAIDIVHRKKGNIDYDSLFAKIKDNLTAQIPLLPSGIDRMLETRKLGLGDTPIVKMVAQIVKDNSLGKSAGAGLLSAWNKEQGILDKAASTAFGVAAAVTRYGQTLSPEGWVRYDLLGGSLVNLDRDAWDNLRKRADTMTVKELEKLIGVAA